jgi:hypothetical protein
MPNDGAPVQGGQTPGNSQPNQPAQQGQPQGGQPAAARPGGAAGNFQPATPGTMKGGSGIAPPKQPPPGGKPAPAKVDPNAPKKPAVDGTTPEMTDAEKAAARRKYQIKVRGEEREVELSDDEIRERIQIAEMSTEKTQSAAQVRKQAEALAVQANEATAKANQVLQTIASDPIGALLKAGVDPEFLRGHMEKHLVGELEREQMSPEQQELMQLRQEKADRDAKAAQDAKEQHERIQNDIKEKAKTHFKTEYEKSILKQLETSGIPKTARMVKMIAENMLSQKQQGFQIDIGRATEAAHEEFQGWIQHAAGDLAKQVKDAHAKGDSKTILQVGERLEALFGKDLIHAIRRYDLTRVRGAQPNVASISAPGKSSTPAKNEAEAKGYKSEEEALEERKQRVARLEEERKRRVGAVNASL